MLLKRGLGGGFFIKYHSHTLFTVVISDEVQAKKGPRPSMVQRWFLALVSEE